MRDASEQSSDAVCPETPRLDSSCTLHRTVSYASIDTVRPPSNKGVRRRIVEIADNLKHKSTKKKKKLSSAHDVSKGVAYEPGSNPKAPPTGRTTKRVRKATAPLRDPSQGTLSIADRLYGGVPSERDSPLTFPGCGSDPPLVDKLLAKEAGQPLKDCGFVIGKLDLGARLLSGCQDAFQFPRTAALDIKDVQLDIRPSESNVTIWDGLRATYHLFKCRLYLRCTAHPYGAVSIPDIRLVELTCNTHPVGSRYARPPVLHTAYQGASPGLIRSSSELPKVKPAAGIHMDRIWRTILDEDGTWGWYRDAFVPFSPRLFHKMEYREFKLVSRVWVEESCVEAELTFGISMLLRELDMM